MQSVLTDKAADLVIQLGAEITFLRQMVDQQKKENEEVIQNLRSVLVAKEAQDKYVKELEMKLDEYTKDRNVENPVKGNGKTDGYIGERTETLDATRGGETESVSGQRGDLDYRSGSHSGSGSTEAETRDANIPRRGRSTFIA